MTPSNLTILNSVREFQKHFNQAFNLSAAALDVTYASTQTIAGGLIVCRNFTVNSGVVLTISNPTTIVCQTFINNGTITMSQVSENILGQFRSTDAPRLPETIGPMSATSLSFNGTASAQLPGCGGASWGRGGVASTSLASGAEYEDGDFFGFRTGPAFGWKDVGMAFWWPIAQFRNPVLGQGAGTTNGKGYYSTSLAYQKKGGGAFSATSAASSFGRITPQAVKTGGLPGSFVEVFAKVSITNAVGATINAQGAAGNTQANTNQGGGGGGGGVGFYCEGFISQLGTINCSGGNGGVNGVGSTNGGGGGGGGIFLTAPIITNSGTNTVSGGNGGVGGAVQGQAGGSGVVVVEPYLRLWMPGEDDVVTGTRYNAN